MTIFDLVIRRGTVATPASAGVTGIAISNGRVAQVGGEMTAAHAPRALEQKLDPALTIENPPPGVSDLETLRPVLFSEGAGSDADLALWDLERRQTIRGAEGKSRAGYSI